MKTDKTRVLALAAALAVAAPFAVSYAQQAAPAAAAPAQPGQPHQHRQKMDPAQRAEHRAERLRAMLQLRPEQEPALKAYVQALQPPAGAREGWRGQRGEHGAMTTPQRIEAQRARIDARRTRFDQHAQATLRFYSQLSPAQQKAFDAMPMRGGGRMRGHGGHERG